MDGSGAVAHEDQIIDIGFGSFCAFVDGGVLHDPENGVANVFGGFGELDVGNESIVWDDCDEADGEKE